MNEIRPTRQVDGRLHERLIKWHQRIAKPTDARLIAKCLSQRCTESECCVLDRVVRVHLKAGRTQKAAAAYDQAIKLDPKYAPAHYYLGMHYKTAKKTKEAKAALEKAVELSGGKGVGEAAKKELEDLK